MEIKNLAQLKRVIQEKREFIIRAHRQEKFLGQKRIPNVVQSMDFYSVISGQPEHEISCANHGKGSWIDFGKSKLSGNFRRRHAVCICQKWSIYLKT